MIDADLLILLTNTNGVYSNMVEMNTVDYSSTKELKKFIISEKSFFGTGGMKSKIMAAELTREKGIKTVIANALEKDVLQKITLGKITGTLIK